MTLPASTLYLLEHSGIRPDSATPQDILIMHARTVRDLVRRWWLALDPEHTAGISVEFMESSLVQLAETLAQLPKHRIAMNQALGLVTRKLVPVHGKAELMIAQRLFQAAARLGVLVAGGTVSFAHSSLLELYLGLAYQEKSTWPTQLKQESLFSFKPLNQPWGRAIWARLSFTKPEDFGDAFSRVAGFNLHLATWYLYCDAEARRRFGGVFAASLLELANWDGGQTDQQMLDRMISSLGDSGTQAARTVLFERDSILPAMWLAARHLGRFGGTEDVDRLTALAHDPNLGWWEVERMRQAIREAQSLALEPEVLRRYRKEELVEFAKKALRVLVLIGGTILLYQLKVNHRFPGLPMVDPSSAEAGAHGLTHSLGHMAHDLGKNTPGEVMDLQRTLREKLAFLPAEIERRKAEIERTRPHVQSEILTASQAVAARDRTATEHREPAT